MPVSGVSPQVVVSLTDERDADDFTFTATNSDYNDLENQGKTSPIRVLPTNGPPHYEVFIFDTGSPAHVLSYDATSQYDIALAGRRGTNLSQIGGAGGEFLEASNSDPVAVYAAGFSAITSAAPLQVDTTQLRGHYNVSVLNGEYNTENPEIDLPNLIGTPIASQYTTRIQNSQPQLIEINGTLRRSPDLQLLTLGAIERPQRRMGLRFESADGAFPLPAFFPDTGNFDINDPGNNPTIPTNTGWFFVDADVENNGVRRNQLEMLFDTGGQATIVSEQVAVTLGFDVELDDPDFVVRIQGVTGTSEEVPGFIAEQFTLPGTAGGLTLTDVPLVVFNLTDPRDQFSTLPGLLGMNVLADRDVIINPEPGNAYLGISDPAIDNHVWQSVQPVASWADASSWDTDVPQVSGYAYVINNTGAPQMAVLAEDTIAGALIAAGNTSVPDGTMTLTVENGVTLTLYGTAILQAGSTLQLNQATLDPQAVELRDGTIRGTGTVKGEVLSQGLLQPGGRQAVGTLTFPGSLDQLARGSLELELRDADQFDRIHVDGPMTVAGRLSISTTDDYELPEPGTSRELPVIEVDDTLFGQFTSYEFNGDPIGVDCSPEDSSACRTISANRFQQHVGAGQFIEVAYRENGVSIVDYQATAGDTNGDGTVAFDDFLRLSDSYGLAGDWRSGDFSGDGFVAFEDFLGLSANFSGGTELAQAAVPEPHALFLVGLGVGGLCLLCRRR